MGLKDFHGIKFGTIKGDFICNDNSFNNFEGFPIKTKKTLSIECNKFITLEGLPEADLHMVNGNPLISLRFTEGKRLDGGLAKVNGTVSSIVIDAIRNTMKKKKLSYDETVKLLEEDIKMGSKLTKEHLEKKYGIWLNYGVSKTGKDSDWDMLDKGQDLTDTVKGLKFLGAIEN
jgi:hypothetical protein